MFRFVGVVLSISHICFSFFHSLVCTRSGGQRKFDVKMEGSTVFSNVDIFAEAGGRDRALTKTARTVSVTDGALNIQFVHLGFQNPTISAIEVVKNAVGGAPPPPPPPPPPSPTQPIDSPLPVSPFQTIYINAGESTLTQGSGGIVWGKDEYFNTGAVYSPKTKPAISGAENSQTQTKDSFLYTTERFDDVLIDPDMVYEIPVPDGKTSPHLSCFVTLTNCALTILFFPEGVFEVRIHMAEIYNRAWEDGARVFDVVIEGVVAFPSLDIYKEVGPNTALTKVANANVKDGALTIEFRAIVENPKVRTR